MCLRLQPQYIVDPDAEMPEDWDEEEEAWLGDHVSGAELGIAGALFGDWKPAGIPGA